MRERADEGPKTEVTTLKHLETAYPDIPALKDLRDWVDSDGRYFMLQGRVYGQTLEQTWSSLSESQKRDIADQVAEVRKKLRSITSTAIQGVAAADGSPCYPALLFSDGEPHGPFHSDRELWDALSRTLHDPPRRTFPQRALENLQKRMPKCQPYLLTHCDLFLGNIIIRDGRLAGILD